MNLIRINKERKIEVLDESSQKLLELGFYTDEFGFIFYTLNPIELTEQDNEYFYHSLDHILKSDYIFDNKFSIKKDNEIIWFSDQTCDLESLYETNMVNHMIIKRDNEKILLSVFNPFFEKNGINRSSYMVLFSPGGNGQYSRNVSTGNYFQNDIVLAYQSVLNNSCSLLKKKK